ncbi:MAG: phage tail sheath subtilisin-like domain-containing protein [Pseudomonadota bacterium]
MAYEHGIRITEREGGTRPVAGSATEVLGLVSVASDADVATFPLDTPVLLTDVRGALAKAGDQGKLAAALEAIAEQSNAIVVVVRATEGSGAGAEAATETNVLAGVDRLLAAESQLGYRPRILGAPGLDSQAVAERLASVAARLRGFTYTSCGAADTVAEAVTYRAEFSAREQMLIYPGTSKGAADAIARAMGLRAKIDRETGWHKTLSNVPIAGVTGLQFPISFDIMASDNDAGVLNDAEVTTIVRQNGYRFWGNSTCSDDPLFRFESVVRTNQALQDEIAAGLAWAVDKPLGGGLLKDILETINGRFRSLRAQGRIIGAEAYFDASLNPAADLAAGKVRIPYRYTACAPAESIGILPEITDEFYATIGQGL